MPDVLAAMNTYEVLDKIDENIFIADSEFQLVWVNKKAKSLLEVVGPYVQISDPEHFIGMNITHFHSERQNRILEEGPFPHRAQVTLFNRFKANIQVDLIQNGEDKRAGFILTWNDVTEYEEAIQEGKELLDEIDTPIIKTVLDSVSLVPIMGKMTEERMESMQKKILFYCPENQITTMIFDFSSFQHSLDPFEVTGLANLVRALKLMGVDPIFVGINARMAQSMTQKQLCFGVPTFNSFRQGMGYLMDKNGYKIVKL
ncbi:STAS domain-containing protein [Peribacillus kribbensis]|uniref:STAS domain-containing protein n=1 Tax=Peribacillus kribbensis TaxID=356658 RepID=UPI00040F7541|nr:STAS domain-containing protein [Peribacillus kribbensis]